MYEIQREKAAEHTQKKVERHISHAEVHNCCSKRAHPSKAEITDQRGRYGAQKKRQYARHGEVEKEDLQSEQHAGKRGVEDARNGSGGATSKEKGHAAVGHSGVSAQI